LVNIVLPADDIYGQFMQFIIDNSFVQFVSDATRDLVLSNVSEMVHDLLV